MQQDRNTVPEAGSEQVKLRLLGMTDLHGYLRGFDYHSGKGNPAVGLSRLATLIRAARSENPNSLLFDNGDTIQGTVLSDRATAMASPDHPHPVIDVLNRLGVDAATIGNHEFNFGLPALHLSYSHASYPVVCANALTRRGEVPAEDETLFPPWRILDRDVTDTEGNQHQLKIGVIGALPPQIMNWDHLYLNGHVVVRGIVESIRGHIPAMRAAGADVVVVLCHSGLGDGTCTADTEHAAAAVAQLDGVDAVIAGHSHGHFPQTEPDTGPKDAGDPTSAGDNTHGQDPDKGTVHGTPLVLPGSWGSHLGVIDLDLRRVSQGWQVVDGRSVLRSTRISDNPQLFVPKDPDVIAWTDPAHIETKIHADQPVGRSANRLHTYFSMIDPGPAMHIVARAQIDAMETLLHNSPYAALPILSAVSPFKCGGRAGPGHYTDVAAGAVSIRNISDLYLYPNSLRGVLADGAMLRNWLERSASAFCQVVPRQPALSLLDPNQPGYEFDTIFGLTYSFDLTVPARFDAATGRLVNPDSHRVQDLQWNGRHLSDEDMFVVATNNYRVGGGGHFPKIPADAVIAETGQSVRDLLIRYIASDPPQIPTPRTWRFRPVPGATVRIDTSPAARSATADIDRLGLTDIGDRADGFAVFELDLSKEDVS